jgi:hypothetical protein
MGQIEALFDLANMSRRAGQTEKQGSVLVEVGDNYLNRLIAMGDCDSPILVVHYRLKGSGRRQRLQGGRRTGSRGDENDG